jgi:hypothetical protein
LRKYLKLQKIHGFFLHLIDFDEEYLFLVLQYLHHDDGGDHDCGCDDDVRGYDCVDVHVRDDVHDCGNGLRDDVHENEYDRRDDGVYDGFLPFWLK